MYRTSTDLYNLGDLAAPQKANVDVVSGGILVTLENVALHLERPLVSVESGFWGRSRRITDVPDPYGVRAVKYAVIRA